MSFNFSSPKSNTALDCLQLRFQIVMFNIEQQWDTAEFLQNLLDNYNYLKLVISFNIVPVKI